MSRYYDDFLCHHGIKGQKLGVRRFQNANGSLTTAGKQRYDLPKRKSYISKTKNGEILTYEPIKGNKFLYKHSSKYRELHDKDFNYNIKNSTGKTVGNVELYKESPSSVNVTWIGVNNKYGHSGYGRATMDFVEKFAKEHGAEKITAEVVGHTPEINHLVDKYGYVRLHQISEDDIWEGLTKIEKTVR